MEVGRLEHRADPQRRLARAPRRACRRSSARPLVGCASPSSIRSVVVFPAPFGPRNPVIVPGSSANDRSRRRARDPNRFVNDSATTASPTAPAPDELGPDALFADTTRTYPTATHSGTHALPTLTVEIPNSSRVSLESQMRQPPCLGMDHERRLVASKSFVTERTRSAILAA